MPHSAYKRSCIVSGVLSPTSLLIARLMCHADHSLASTTMPGREDQFGGRRPSERQRLYKGTGVVSLRNAPYPILIVTMSDPVQGDG
ncbi:hypothetical protein GCM10023194_25340 [Planotetraspora phitsanulokensis]|uniref:Uncharacterized protein n=1 Tax=Planotetraspora phitsanulokensis TaxID=575192 RepID=A0A8J3UEM0_9ACTN|nr:hypothetical protein Pph01_68840 [Planotetraspora phitsanulokensis]